MKRTNSDNSVTVIYSAWPKFKKLWNENKHHIYWVVWKVQVHSHHIYRWKIDRQNYFQQYFFCCTSSDNFKTYHHHSVHWQPGLKNAVILKFIRLWSPSGPTDLFPVMWFTQQVNVGELRQNIFPINCSVAKKPNTV